MKQSLFVLERVKKLTADTYELTLLGDTSDIKAPGQFVNIALPRKYLRRPISVCDWKADSLTLLVKAVGEGTHELVTLSPGTKLDTLSGLGNGFSLESSGTRPLLVGGGIGIAPLYGLARRLLERGTPTTIILGYRTQKDIFYVDKFKDLGCQVFVTTEDGSAGIKGFVTEAIREHSAQMGWDQVMTCGPIPMLKAVWKLPDCKQGQFSLEARMACGFGACVGCTILTANGPRRVCKDGPIFQKEELVW